MSDGIKIETDSGNEHVADELDQLQTYSALAVPTEGPIELPEEEIQGFVIEKGHGTEDLL